MQGSGTCENMSSLFSIGEDELDLDDEASEIFFFVILVNFICICNPG